MKGNATPRKIDIIAQNYEGQIILQNNATSAIIAANFATGYIDEMARKFIIQGNHGMTIQFDLSTLENIPLRLKTSTRKLFAYILELAAEGKVKEKKLLIDFDDYFKNLNITSKKYAFNVFKNDIAILRSITISGKVVKHGEKPLNLNTGLYRKSYSPMDNPKQIVLLLEDEFDSMLKDKSLCFYMAWSKAFYKFDDKSHPNAFSLIYAIHRHVRINIDNKKRKSLIPISTLISECPELQREKAVSKSNRGYSQRIKEPFENDMLFLKKERGLQYEYITKEGVKKKYNELSYEEWKESSVRIKKLPDFTGFGEEIAKRKEKRRKAIEKAKLNAAIAREEKKLEAKKETTQTT